MRTPGQILDESTTIAVVGASRHEEKAAYAVPLQLKLHGWRVIPVEPVRRRDLGRTVLREARGHSRVSGSRQCVPRLPIRRAAVAPATRPPLAPGQSGFGRASCPPSTPDRRRVRNGLRRGPVYRRHPVPSSGSPSESDPRRSRRARLMFAADHGATHLRQPGSPDLLRPAGRVITRHAPRLHASPSPCPVMFAADHWARATPPHTAVDVPGDVRHDHWARATPPHAAVDVPGDVRR